MKSVATNILSISIFLALVLTVSAQPKSNLPYYEIQDYPAAYTAGTVAARVLDGLGFRYYWATEGLREVDLKYKPVGTPDSEARTTEETIQHIYSLTHIIINTTTKSPTLSGALDVKIPFDQLRKNTLENIKTAANILRSAKDNEVAEMKVVFKSDAGLREFPFWNILNGPVDDALWHVGQLITFRRSSGNPYNSKASVFTGKVNP